MLGLQELGIVNRGSGADNVRNITAPCTAGIDTQEIYDVRELAKQMHYHIINRRELYGLPRKFNIAFDGGGTTSALEDTNDIGFAAVCVGEGKSQPAGIYFRVLLGGITGHKDFARDCGLLLKPEQCIPVAHAMLQVFISNGDRTDRKKARLKYLLDQWGHEKFLAETQKLCKFELPRLPLADCENRGPILKHIHVGVVPQKQAGCNYIGIVLPVGRMTCEQMRGLAKISQKYGNGTLRLTVWQNVIITDVPDDAVEAVKTAVQELGLNTDAGSIRAALTACTGNAGCKFAASNTKKHAPDSSIFSKNSYKSNCQSISISQVALIRVPSTTWAILGCLARKLPYLRIRMKCSGRGPCFCRWRLRPRARRWPRVVSECRCH